MPQLAILIPHKRDALNDAALAIAMNCIVRNTDADYELLIDGTTPACPYEVLNRLAERAQADYIVFSNSDVFFAPGWAQPMLNEAAPRRIVSGVLVEPGAIGVSAQNHQRNFGMTPDQFDRAGFEEWVSQTAEFPHGNGWYFPSLHHRQTFLDRGGFDLRRGNFPEPLDKYYWDAWGKDGYEVRRVSSFAYHLQNWSNPLEQEKAVRYG